MLFLQMNMIPPCSLSFSGAGLGRGVSRAVVFRDSCFLRDSSASAALLLAADTSWPMSDPDL